MRAGRTIALANKECLVCAGDLMMREALRHKARILPVDSEHNAIFQVFERDNAKAVDKVILTASGGPFRGWSREAMASVGPEKALRHPNWDMGARVSIDSATLMNKGLEVIEAFHLFPIERQQLEVLVHPQSAVHGLVQYTDGSLLAQLGAPDMRTPIAYCLSWPERMPTPVSRLDLAALQQLTFEAPDTEAFPALDLAWAALERGEGATAVLNGADEVAVAAFLDRRIGFLSIADVVARALESAEAHGLLREPGDLETALELDAAARRLATQSIDAICAARRTA
ncbi:1-deoxy-D-xylulose-5-phosphate reductoisomerase [Breoghania sp. L-A4]|uniref:1-deoxy-D-xylulose-5-phosphate reductoisomerase n=1 Tax=Breoghania sp. L-A4 TaxID=2304600 RepID=UPI003204F715